MKKLNNKNNKFSYKYDYLFIKIIMIDKLNIVCNQYISNPKYVFKSCDNYIVVFEKLYDTITNEYRNNVSKYMYAKYRANKLKVILIINKFDPFITIKEIENTSYEDNKIRYEKDKIVEVNDYDMDLNKVCTKGIHYFKTIKQAFYWELFKFCPKYTGKLISWYENGNKKEESEYLDGRLAGRFIKYYKNGKKGKKKCEGEYLDDKRIGTWIYYYKSGDITCYDTY